MPKHRFRSRPRTAPATHTLVAPTALARLTEAAFGLRSIAPPRLLQVGLNDHYALQTPQGDFVLQVYRHGWRTNDDVAWELDLLAHLRQARAPVAAAVPCRDGRLFTELVAPEGVRQVAVFERAPGVYTHFGANVRHRASPATFPEAFGRSMARFTRPATASSPPHRASRSSSPTLSASRSPPSLTSTPIAHAISPRWRSRPTCCAPR